MYSATAFPSRPHKVRVGNARSLSGFTARLAVNQTLSFGRLNREQGALAIVQLPPVVAEFEFGQVAEVYLADRVIGAVQPALQD